MSSKLETRVATLERELASLREEIEGQKLPWWKQNLGQFANDPNYAKAMELGRAFLEGQRPQPKPKTLTKSASKGGSRVRSTPTCSR